MKEYWTFGQKNWQCQSVCLYVRTSVHMSVCMFEHKSKCLFVCSNTHNFYNNQLIEATPTLLPPFWLNTGLALGSKMKEIRIENGSMYFERLIQVTKNPKGEQRPPKAALKRVSRKERFFHFSSFLFTVLATSVLTKLIFHTKYP